MRLIGKLEYSHLLSWKQDQAIRPVLATIESSLGHQGSGRQRRRARRGGCEVGLPNRSAKRWRSVRQTHCGMRLRLEKTMEYCVQQRCYAASPEVWHSIDLCMFNARNRTSSKLFHKKSLPFQISMARCIRRHFRHPCFRNETCSKACLETEV